MNSNKSVDEILQEIKNGEDVDFMDMLKLTLADLLQVDENNITYLEYVCNNNLEMWLSGDVKHDIENSKEALLILIKVRSLTTLVFSKIQNEDIFFELVENNKTILDLIFSDDECFFSCKFFKKRIDILDYIEKYQDYYQIDGLSDEIIIQLFEEKDGKFLIDKYFNDKKMGPRLIQKASLDLLLSYCKKKNNFEFLKYVNEESLLSNIEDNKTVLEFLLENNITPLFYQYEFKDDKTLSILIKYNRWDLLYNADMELLFKEYSSEKCYLDVMVEKHENGENMSFEKISDLNYYFSLSSEKLAQELIYMAKKDIIGFVPNINSKMLLYKNWNDPKNVISWLVEMDKDLTVSVILPYCNNRRDPDLAIALKSLGIESLINIESDEKNLSDEVISDYNKEYVSDKPNNYEELLLELRDLFYNDGISEKEYVDAFITSYRYLLSENRKFALEELLKIIEIKKTFPKNFVLKNEKNVAYFSPKEGFIALSNAIISTINHETTHALHYYLTKEKVPDNFYEVIKRIRENPKTIEMVAKYSRMFVGIREETKDAISKSKIAEYYDSKYTGEKKDKLRKFLLMEKELKKIDLRESYPEDVLDIILEKTYSVEEFIEQRKQLEELELVDATIRNKYDAFLAISDIIDAIFLGKFRNEVLYCNGKKIEGAYGHGIDYYSNETFIFCEIIANYGSLIKSKNNSEENLKLLREIVGDELVDMLDEFYTQMILNSQILADYKGEEVEVGYAR